MTVLSVKKQKKREEKMDVHEGKKMCEYETQKNVCIKTHIKKNALN